MPSKPKHVCNGCGQSVSGRCDQCHKKNRSTWEKNRPSAHARGYGARWRKLRTMVLHRDPICVICNHAAATDCDHIVPKADGGEDRMENLQGICWDCHTQKTATENQERMSAQSAHNLNRL